MKINYVSHLLRFIDQTTYEAEIGSPLPKNVTLPASRIDSFIDSRSFKVTIILPKKLETAEVVVNITRNVFSKLFGNIFFNEQILPLEFYQQSVKGQKQITAAIPEILDLVKEFNFHSDSLEGHCESVAKSYRLSMEKEGDQIRKQLINEWHEKWRAQTLSNEEQHTLFSIFTEFKELFRTNPELFNKKVSERVKQLNSHLYFILPHEMRVYENFEQERFSHYIRSVLHKLEEISALVGFIEELYQLLKQPPEAVELDSVGTQNSIQNATVEKREKSDSLLCSGYAAKFRIGPYTAKISIASDKNASFRNPLERMVKRNKKKWKKYYAESIYSKLYSALHSLSAWTQSPEESRAADFLESADGLRLKRIMSVMKFRLPAIKSIQSSLGVLLDTNEETVLQAEPDTVPQRQLIPLDDFRKAWSYFCSSVLTLLYYQEFTESVRASARFQGR